ncbi:phospho-acceptor domain-containing protein [Flavobacterium sp. 103]|uniref:sensor histidine kinase n=1 Tax=Flavobacterium sp. 103 TaxID=2135624 RepID=UPI000D5E5F4B|nr:ATP-binding protein [Flavobacterium sp. 103]PVX47174.1 phospho-acceptor domain-containing protein [Flavobacterium sp. 103]
MNFDYILLLIVFSHLRRALQSKILLPKIDKYLAIGFWFSIALMIAQLILDSHKGITAWIAHAMLFSLIYFCLTQKEFKSVKSFIYSILPFVVVNFIEDCIELINSPFHDEWNNYFDTAIFFSIVWFFAMFFITRKQRKEMEKEQLKAIEFEKEFQQSEILKEKLEKQVAERTAEILGQKEKLQKALDKLKTTQVQLIQSEKMASLGELTAGIAHEIQNPLNFVNNFSEVSSELLDEMNEEIEKGDFEEVKNIASDIKKNLEKINYHGKRADSIVKGMLQHSRIGNNVKEPTNINKLADEYLRLAYHGLRAKDKSFNADLVTDFDENLPKINVLTQEIGRVLLNLFTNAFYATQQMQKKSGETYKPMVSVKTVLKDKGIEITVKDNGIGIPEAIKEKIMQPFFTTKPTGEGTGLGLSLSYDIIVKAHGGRITVDSRENDYTAFTIFLPLE